MQAGYVATAFQIGHKGEILFNRNDIEILRQARVRDKPDIRELRYAAIFTHILSLLSMVIAVRINACSKRIAERNLLNAMTD